jgi:hypothetical protein
MAGIIYLMLTVTFIQTLFTGELQNILATAAWSIFIGNCFYLVIHRPSIEIFDEGIKITNPIFTHEWGWNEVDEIETKYAFAVQSGERLTYSFAAPAPGRYHARTVHESELRGMRIAEVGSIRPGDSPRSHSGVAAYLARNRLENFRNNGMSPSIIASTTINRGGISVIALSSFLGLLLSFYHF